MHASELVGTFSIRLRGEQIVGSMLAFSGFFTDSVFFERKVALSDTKAGIN